MLDTELHNAYSDVDPAPRFAIDAEIEIAEQLRHQLEERYLGPVASPSPKQARSSEGH